MANNRARCLYGSLWGLNVAEGTSSRSGGLPVVQSAKPQLARLQESGLEARGWGRDVDPIDVQELKHTRRPHIIKASMSPSRHARAAKCQGVQHCETNHFISNCICLCLHVFFCGLFVRASWM